MPETRNRYHKTHILLQVCLLWSPSLAPRSANTRDPDENLLEQLQDAGARLRQRGRERDAARKQLAARNDMLAQVLKEQQY